MARRLKQTKAPEWKEGDKVDYHGIIGGPVDHADCTVTSDPWEMCGSMVVRIDKVRGAVSVEALTRAADGGPN